MIANVRDAPYNAAGNGIADDTAAIQTAIDASIAAGGGTVYLPAGTYRTTATLTVNGEDVGLLGEGYASNIHLEASVTDGLRLVDATRCWLRDLRVSGGAGAVISRLIHITATVSTENVSCWGVFAIGTPTVSACFGVAQDTNLDVSEIAFFGCRADGGDGATYGWLLGNGSVGNVLSIRMYSCDARGLNTGVFTYCAQFQWYGGTSSNNSGYDFRIGGVYTLQPVVIQGVRSELSNMFLHCDQVGTASPSVRVQDCVIWKFSAPSKRAIECKGSVTLDGVVALNDTNDPVFYSEFAPGFIATDVCTNNPNPPWSGVAPRHATGVYTLDSGYNRTNQVGNNVRVEESNVVPFSATPVFDASLGSHQSTVLTGTVASSTIKNPQRPGQVITIEWVQNGSGSRPYTWPTNCRFATTHPPNATMAANRSDSVTFRWDGALWREIGRAINVPVT